MEPRNRKSSSHFTDDTEWRLGRHVARVAELVRGRDRVGAPGPAPGFCAHSPPLPRTGHASPRRRWGLLLGPRTDDAREL